MMGQLRRLAGAAECIVAAATAGLLAHISSALEAGYSERTICSHCGLPAPQARSGWLLTIAKMLAACRPGPAATRCRSPGSRLFGWAAPTSRCSSIWSGACCRRASATSAQGAEPWFLPFYFSSCSQASLCGLCLALLPAHKHWRSCWQQAGGAVCTTSRHTLHV